MAISDLLSPSQLTVRSRFVYFRPACYSGRMGETRKIAAIFAADVVGYSRLVAAAEERTLARLRALRSDLLDPVIAVHRGRVVKRIGDGVLVDFGSVVDALRCAVEVQTEMMERNTGLPQERRIEFRMGVHLGDVVEEVDGDLMGNGVNIAARLEGLAEPGGICLSEDAYRQVRGKVGVTFVDLGDQQLKNIAQPTRVYRVHLDSKVPLIADDHPLSEGSIRQGRPSIAVLPFQNISGDPEQEYFAEGMVEDIITGLSRIKWLFVIARNSSSRYKGKTADLRQVGRELGVGYLLEGGVRKAGHRVRITAHLLEVETGAHLWADRFDGGIEDIFDLQDQITDQVVAIVEPSVQRSEIERSRRKRPDNLAAYDLYLRAVPYTATQMPEDARVAIQFLERALSIDPSYAAAHALMAWCHEWCFSRAGFADADRLAALQHARAAIVGSTDDATALAVGGFVITMVGKDYDAGVRAIERALAINPSCATALYLGALTNAFSGRPGRAVAYAKRALQLSPFDLLTYQAHLASGFAALQESRNEDAAAHLAEALQTNPSLSSIYFVSAAALALSGRRAEAKSMATRGLEIEPAFRLRMFRELMVPAVADRCAEGGRLLGLSE